MMFLKAAAVFLSLSTLAAGSERVDTTEQTISDASVFKLDLIDQDFQVRSFDNTLRLPPKSSLRGSSLEEDDDDDLDGTGGKLDYREKLDRSGFENSFGTSEPRIVMFDNDYQVNMLSDEAKNKIKQGFEDGFIVLGCQDGKGANSASILAKFGVEMPGLDDISMDGDDLVEDDDFFTNSWVVFRRNAKGFLQELHLDDIRDDEAFKDAYTDIVRWFTSTDIDKEPEVRLLETSDPWNAIHTYERRGYTYGEYRGSMEKFGTYEFRAQVFFLGTSSDNVNGDYFRVDYQTESNISDGWYKRTGTTFGDTKGTCGWWTDKVAVALDVLTTNGVIYDYAPRGTVGSTSTTFGVGASISSSPGVNVGYSKTYGQKYVTIKTLKDSMEHNVYWEASLKGCEGPYATVGASGASTVAKTSYGFDPTAILRVPANRNLNIQMSVPKKGSWGFENQKDHWKVQWYGAVKVYHYYGGKKIAPKLTCSKGGCSSS